MERALADTVQELFRGMKVSEDPKESHQLEEWVQDRKAFNALDEKARNFCNAHFAKQLEMF